MKFERTVGVNGEKEMKTFLDRIQVEYLLTQAKFSGKPCGYPKAVSGGFWSMVVMGML